MTLLGLTKRTASLAIRTFCTTSCKSAKLDGKVAIVTASTDGIGFSIAKRLCQDGAKVVICSRKEENVQSAVKKLESYDVLGVACHVGKQEQRTNLIDKTVEKYGGVDIFVSNAGMNPAFGPILDTTEEQWDKIFDINVKAAFLLCKEIVPHMENRKGANITFITSISGYTPFDLLGAYSVSKTTLLGLTKALAPQCASLDIRVNAVAPGVIKTKFSKALYANPQVEEMFLRSVPLNRIGEADEIAGIVSFLSSDDASYITGETIAVTGGMPGRL